MENLLLSSDGQRVLLRFKKMLERKYCVKIFLPENVSSCASDLVVATVLGENTWLVKNFIQRRMDQMEQRREQRTEVQNNVTTITLSDSDSDVSSTIPGETQQKRKRRQNCRGKRMCAEIAPNHTVDLSSTILIEDSSDESESQDLVQNGSNAGKENIVNLSGTEYETYLPLKVNSEPPISAANFLPLNNAQINSSIIDYQVQNSSNARKENVKFNGTECETYLPLKVNSEPQIPSANFVPLNNTQINSSIIEDQVLDETIILSDSPPPPNFISLHSRKEKKNIPNEIDDSSIIIEEEVPRPIETNPRRLRPIVIDGSNVARAHGQVGNTYSCKGIQIAINYFLERGHAPVTAMVPLYQRHKRFGPVLTTDQPLLEELAKKQQVVFTPSRRIENRSISCYDDRFIVELATKTGGVILSNDNFRDIAAENEEFKKTIQERLLMYCFVGDVIMIPQDPLGRNGPTLDNFLSFPK